MKTLQSVHVKIRNHLCQTCPTQCAGYLDSQIDLRDAELACTLPEPRWTVNLRGVHRMPVGRLVQAVLAPGVAVSDAALGTNLKGCESCGDRVYKLNEFGEVILDVAADAIRRARKLME